MGTNEADIGKVSSDIGNVDIEIPGHGTFNLDPRVAVSMQKAIDLAGGNPQVLARVARVAQIQATPGVAPVRPAGRDTGSVEPTGFATLYDRGLLSSTDLAAFGLSQEDVAKARAEAGGAGPGATAQPSARDAVLTPQDQREGATRVSATERVRMRGSREFIREMLDRDLGVAARADTVRTTPTAGSVDFMTEVEQSLQGAAKRDAEANAAIARRTGVETFGRGFQRGLVSPLNIFGKEGPGEVRGIVEPRVVGAVGEFAGAVAPVLALHAATGLALGTGGVIARGAGRWVPELAKQGLTGVGAEVVHGATTGALYEVLATSHDEFDTLPERLVMGTVLGAAADLALFNLTLIPARKGLRTKLDDALAPRNAADAEDVLQRTANIAENKKAPLGVLVRDAVTRTEPFGLGVVDGLTPQEAFLFRRQVNQASDVAVTAAHQTPDGKIRVAMADNITRTRLERELTSTEKIDLYQRVMGNKAQADDVFNVLTLSVTDDITADVLRVIDREIDPLLAIRKLRGGDFEQFVLVPTQRQGSRTLAASAAVHEYVENILLLEATGRGRPKVRKGSVDLVDMFGVTDDVADVWAKQLDNVTERVVAMTESGTLNRRFAAASVKKAKSVINASAESTAYFTRNNERLARLGELMLIDMDLAQRMAPGPTRALGAMIDAQSPKLSAVLRGETVLPKMMQANVADVMFRKTGQQLETVRTRRVFGDETIVLDNARSKQFTKEGRFEGQPVLYKNKEYAYVGAAKGERIRLRDPLTGNVKTIASKNALDISLGGNVVRREVAEKAVRDLMKKPPRFLSFWVRTGNNVFRTDVDAAQLIPLQSTGGRRGLAGLLARRLGRPVSEDQILEAAAEAATKAQKQGILWNDDGVINVIPSTMVDGRPTGSLSAQYGRTINQMDQSAAEHFGHTIVDDAQGIFPVSSEDLVRGALAQAGATDREVAYFANLATSMRANTILRNVDTDLKRALDNLAVGQELTQYQEWVNGIGRAFESRANSMGYKVDFTARGNLELRGRDGVYRYFENQETAGAFLKEQAAEGEQSIRYLEPSEDYRTQMITRSGNPNDVQGQVGGIPEVSIAGMSEASASPPHLGEQWDAGIVDGRGDTIGRAVGFLTAPARLGMITGLADFAKQAQKLFADLPIMDIYQRGQNARLRYLSGITKKREGLAGGSMKESLERIEALSLKMKRDEFEDVNNWLTAASRKELIDEAGPIGGLNDQELLSVALFDNLDAQGQLHHHLATLLQYEGRMDNIRPTLKKWRVQAENASLPSETRAVYQELVTLADESVNLAESLEALRVTTKKQVREIDQALKGANDQQRGVLTAQRQRLTDELIRQEQLAKDGGLSLERWIEITNGERITPAMRKAIDAVERQRKPNLTGFTDKQKQIIQTTAGSRWARRVNEANKSPEVDISIFKVARVLEADEAGRAGIKLNPKQSSLADELDGLMREAFLESNTMRDDLPPVDYDLFVRGLLPEMKRFHQVGVTADSPFISEYFKLKGQEGLASGADRMARQLAAGHFDLYQRDPRTLASKITRMKMMEAHFDQEFEDQMLPALQIIKEAARGATEAQPNKVGRPDAERIHRMMKQYLEELRGAPHDQIKKLGQWYQSAMGHLGVTASPTDVQSFINLITSGVYFAAIPFRIGLIMRNMVEIFKIIPRLGAKEFNSSFKYLANPADNFANFKNMYKAAQKANAVTDTLPLHVGDTWLMRIGDRSLQDMASDVPILGAIADSDMYLKTGVVRQKGKEMLHAGIRFYQMSDDVGRTMAYHTQTQRFDRAYATFAKAEKTTENVARFLQESKLSGFDEGDQRIMLDMIQKNSVEEARNFAGKLFADETFYRYGHANHPAGWNSVTGRFFGQFGTWPIQFKDWVLNGLTRGTTKDKMEFIGWNAAVNGGLAVGGASVGIDTSKWIGFTSLGYKGGPWGDVMVDAVRVWSGSPLERQLAWDGLQDHFIPTEESWRSWLLPGSFAAEDIKRLGSGDADLILDSATSLQLFQDGENWLLDADGF